MKISHCCRVLAILTGSASLVAGGFVGKRMVPTTTPSTTSTAPSTQLQSVPNAFDTLTSGLSSICRLPFGITVQQPQSQPPQQDQDKNSNKRTLFKLFDIENSRACRAVRERITEYDLQVERVIPCAVNSRARTDPTSENALPAGCQVPTLIVQDSESNDGTRILNGTDAIVEYLDGQYKEEESPSDTADEDDVASDIIQKVSGVLSIVGSYIAGALRAGRGEMVSPAAKDASNTKPLILYSYEGNQFCRLVREVFTELDLVYELRSAGKLSPRREELAELTGGSSQCPYMVDPNTGVAMSESGDIVQYLYNTYAKWTPPNEVLEWTSETVMPVLKTIFSILAPVQAGSTRNDSAEYQKEIEEATAEIEKTVNGEDAVVIYTYQLSPFCSEAKTLLENLGVAFKEVSLGYEWLPGFMGEGAAQTRVALMDMTDQSSLPHIFVNGKSIGGLFSGTPGLIPSFQDGSFVKHFEGPQNNTTATTTTTSSSRSTQKESSKDYDDIMTDSQKKQELLATIKQKAANNTATLMLMLD